MLMMLGVHIWKLFRLYKHHPIGQIGAADAKGMPRLSARRKRRYKYRAQGTGLGRILDGTSWCSESTVSCFYHGSNIPASSQDGGTKDKGHTILVSTHSRLSMLSHAVRDVAEIEMLLFLA